jgi:hypothetical protein
MKKKTGLLIMGYTAFYGLIHLSRHLPELAKGDFDLGGETTLQASLLRNGADMLIGFLFTLLPYLILWKYYPGKRFKPLILLMAASLSATFLLSYACTNLMEKGQVILPEYFAFSVFFYAVNIVFGFVFYFIRYAHYKELQEKELTVQNRDTELSFLRSQINPHFLFNNLNNIYSLVFAKSGQALSAISELSDLMRYMLYDTAEMVSLATEVNYIDKYIALQQLRFEKPVPVLFEATGRLNEISLPPLLLIPFVENAFKHGDPAAGDDWLAINLAADDEGIRFTCVNRVGHQHKDATGGIGIENVRRRLELLYPEHHELEIRNDQNFFTVILTLIYGK